MRFAHHRQHGTASPASPVSTPRPARRRIRRGAALLAAAALALSSCSEPSAVERQEAGGVITWVRTDEFGGFAHQVSGVINAGEGGCLTVALDDEDNPQVAVWPRGSYLADDGASVELPNGMRVQVGDRIIGTAGVLSVGRGNDYDGIKEVCNALSFVEWTQAAPAE